MNDEAKRAAGLAATKLRSSAPAMASGAWLDVLEEHYLRGFVAAGGAAVKFVVAMDGDVESVRAGVCARAQAADFLVASVDAASTRAHMADQLFFAVAGALDWRWLCERRLRLLARKLGYAEPGAGDAPFLSRLADVNALTADFLSLPMRRAIQEHVFGDTSLARDFRVAMTHLCLATLDGRTSGQEFVDLHGWLAGTQKGTAQLKPYQIFSRITRHSARHLFESLTHWIARCNLPGLAITLDIGRIVDPARALDGVRYSKASALDAYEVLRQFIDGSERLGHLLLVVVAGPAFLLPEGKGIEHYQALKYRVYDEVHDRRRANPLGTLVRVRTAPMFANAFDAGVATTGVS